MKLLRHGWQQQLCLSEESGKAEQETLKAQFFLAWLSRPFNVTTAWLTFPLSPLTNLIFASNSLTKNSFSDAGNNSTCGCPVACPISLSPSFVIVMMKLGASSYCPT